MDELVFVRLSGVEKYMLTFYLTIIHREQWVTTRLREEKEISVDELRRKWKQKHGEKKSAKFFLVSGCPQEVDCSRSEAELK
jgi:hypothetical protein